MFAGTVGDQGRLANDSFFSNRHGLQPVRDAEAQTKAICEALMQRLLPALSSIVEEVVANATARVLQEKGVVRSGVTELGPCNLGKSLASIGHSRTLGNPGPSEQSFVFWEEIWLLHRPSSRPVPRLSRSKEEISWWKR